MKTRLRRALYDLSSKINTELDGDDDELDQVLPSVNNLTILISTKKGKQWQIVVTDLNT